jgi:hypothetical protein
MSRVPAFTNEANSAPHKRSQTAFMIKKLLAQTNPTRTPPLNQGLAQANPIGIDPPPGGAVGGRLDLDASNSPKEVSHAADCTGEI